MPGERIQIADTTGYLARPETTEARPAVVVIQEWWGLNAHIQDVTRRVADAGFVALAPDLYHGKVATEPDEARKAVMELNANIEQARTDVFAAIDTLKSFDFVDPKKVGMIGFCMGGGLTLRMTAWNPDVAAAVAFYGSVAPEAVDFAASEAAILSLVGDLDEGAVASNTSLHEGLTARGYSHPHELIVYPGAHHAFFNDTRPAYHADAATDAWTRTLDWLRTHIV